LITIRPSIFCFLGKLAPDLYASVPSTIRRRLGVVPDVFAFVSATEEGVDLKLGSRRPRLPPLKGTLQNKLWSAITYASAAIGIGLYCRQQFDRLAGRAAPRLTAVTSSGGSRTAPTAHNL